MFYNCSKKIKNKKTPNPIHAALFPTIQTAVRQKWFDWQISLGEYHWLPALSLVFFCWPDHITCLREHNFISLILISLLHNSEKPLGLNEYWINNHRISSLLKARDSKVPIQAYVLSLWFFWPLNKEANLSQSCFHLFIHLMAESKD